MGTKGGSSTLATLIQFLREVGLVGRKLIFLEYYYFEAEEHTDIGGEVVGYLIQIGGFYKDRPKLKWQALCYQFWTVVDNKITKGTEVS